MFAGSAMPRPADLEDMKIGENSQFLPETSRRAAVDAAANRGSGIRLRRAAYGSASTVESPIRESNSRNRGSEPSGLNDGSTAR
jgi:hypothetical protein